MSTPKLEFINYLDNDWQIFAARQEQANIFHHPAWSQLMQECYGYRPFIAALRDANGKIYAGLPMMEIKGMFTHHRWVSMPFSDHCSPLYCDSVWAEKLTGALIAQAQKPGVPQIVLRWGQPAAQSEIPPSAEYILHTIQLDKSLEKAAGQIHHSHLRNVKTAQTHGVQIKFGRSLEDMQAFYALHLQTRHRQGVPIQPYHYFKLLHKLLIDQGLGFVLLAYKNGQCLAGAVFLHWNHTLTYKYGASKPDGLPLRPNHLIFWNAIQWGCENEYRLLDLGRSDPENSGLRKFKNLWGGQEIPLSYQNFPKPIVHLRAGKILKTIIQTFIQKTPVEICKFGGVIYYKYLA